MSVEVITVGFIAPVCWATNMRFDYTFYPFRFVTDTRLMGQFSVTGIRDLKLNRWHPCNGWSLEDMDSFVNHMNRSLDAHIRPMTREELVTKMRSNW
jgi:hypothetical protein